MNNIERKVVLSVRGINLGCGYFVKVLMNNASIYYLNNSLENEGEISFSQLKKILSKMKLQELYVLKKETKNAQIVMNIIDDELRSRHKSLNVSTTKKQYSKMLRDKKIEKIDLANGMTLIRASLIKNCKVK